MKITGCMAVLLLGCCPLGPASAQIYSYAAPDGTIHLSNVPIDARYKPFVAAPEEAGPGAAAVPPSVDPAAKARYDRIVADVARAHGLESALLHAVISVESRYNPKAVSKAGARGLMQLMPGTGKRFGVTNLLDPVQNLRAGARYLSFLLEMFNKDLKLALAAYNAGEGTVIKHGNRIPPYRETQQYVPKVLSYYRMYQALL